MHRIVANVSEGSNDETGAGQLLCGHETTTPSKISTGQPASNQIGRIGWQKPTGRAPKSFVSNILVSKFFEIRILRGISR
jgi:hypothetical protein